MRTLVIGMGITGQALVRFLQERGEPFDTFDDGKLRHELDLEASVNHFNHVDSVDPSQYDRALVSPGLPRDHAVTQALIASGAPVLSEIELAFVHAPGKVIAVTGSNGKSTTASLIHHLLAGAGLKSSLCGNIGKPFISCIDDDPDHHYVVEVSSFQLEHVISFRPAIGLLLNISPDHLVWHGGFEAYEAAKLRLFARQQPDDLALICSDYLERIPGQATKRPMPGPGASIIDGELDLGDTYRVALNRLPLLGKHNHSNALFACAVAKQFGVSAQTVTALLPSFKGLEHRMERVGELDGRLWINDTKATNVQACQAVADAMEQPYVLILGGCDKGESYSDLDFSMRPPRHIVAYGETAEQICMDLAHLAPRRVHLFRDACVTAQEIANPGDVVLLAPACASFDQFDNFAQRGRVFKRIFAELANVGEPQ